MVSHHKGIKHLLKWAGKKEKIRDPDYCTTIQLKIHSDSASEKGYSVGSCDILS